MLYFALFSFRIPFFDEFKSELILLNNYALTKVTLIEKKIEIIIAGILLKELHIRNWRKVILIENKKLIYAYMKR